jgi:hypothetical protein
MDGVAHIVLGLTAIERWGATRRIEPRSASQHWFALVGVVVLLVLLVLLVVTSYRRYQQSKRKEQKTETFADNAQRRGLDVRERQILLAIALRSGVQHTHEVFHEIDALNRGMAQLLAECAQTRTPQEIDDLKAEISRLRLKLGFDKASAGGGGPARAQASSRQSPVGAGLELTGRSEREAVTLRAEVLRNDEIELAVALLAPLASKAGDSWLARYYVGMSAWEFRTSTVRCDGRMLVLNHSGEVRFIDRRRFLRVAVRSPALVAHLPFLRRDWAAGEATSQGTDAPPPADAKGTPNAMDRVGEPNRMAEYAPVFVESTVTELAGPGLRIETPLQVQMGDQVLVVLRLAEGIEGAQNRVHTVVAVGRVEHGRDIERGVAIPDAIDRVWEGSPQRDFLAVAAQPQSVAVELTGLSNEEIEELVSITNELFSRTQNGRDKGAAAAQELPTPTMTAT